MDAFTGVKEYFKQVFAKTLEDGYITFNDLTKRKSFFHFYDEYKELEELMNNLDWSLYRQGKSKNSPYFLQNKDKVKQYFKYKGTIERRSYNYRVQGSSADITKVALMLIFNYILDNNLFKKVKIANVVHDEILVECPLEMDDEIKDLVYKSMVRAGEMFFTRVKLDAVAESGDHWIH